MGDLPLLHLVDLHARYLCFDDQGNAGRENLDDRLAGLDDAPWRMVVEADDRAGDRRLQDGTVEDVLGLTRLLTDGIELRLGALDLVERGLLFSVPRLDHLLLEFLDLGIDFVNFRV